MSKKLRFILTLSITFNLLCFGLIAGSMGRVIMHKKSMHHSENAPERRAQKEQSKAQREAILDILTAPEFDAAAYDAAVEALHSIQRDLHLKRAAVIREQALSMSQDERIALADSLKNRKGPRRGPSPR